MKYDTPIEVTQKQYFELEKYFGSVLARREDKGKYYIKVWSTMYNKEIKELLDSVK